MSKLRMECDAVVLRIGAGLFLAAVCSRWSENARLQCSRFCVEAAA